MPTAARPTASVVIATYNSARFLVQTLESILSQDYTELEVVLVDDGSSDDTQEVVTPFLGSRVRYIQEEHSGGPSRPRNVGIRNARGKYVFIFDSDDLMLPGKISRSIELLESDNRVGLVFTNFTVADEQGSPSSTTFLERYHYFQRMPKQRVGEGLYAVRGALAYEGLAFENFIGTSSVAVRASVLLKVGGFDESLANSEDHDLWFRIARHSDLGYVDIVGHRYRTHGSSILAGSAERLAPNRITVLRRQLDQGLSRRAARAARRRIAENYFNLGYEQRCLRRWSRARTYYLQGLKEAVTWPLVKGVVRTFLTPGGPN